MNTTNVTILLNEISYLPPIREALWRPFNTAK